MKKNEQKLNHPISGAHKNDTLNDLNLDSSLRNKKRGSTMKEIFGSVNVSQSSFAYKTEFGIRSEDKIPNKGLEQGIKDTKDSYKEGKKTRKNSCHYFGKSGGFFI